jgi:hypothetical protein
MERLNHFSSLPFASSGESGVLVYGALHPGAFHLREHGDIFRRERSPSERDPYAHPDRIGAIYAQTAVSEPGDGEENIDGEQWELLRDNAPSVVTYYSVPMQTLQTEMLGPHSLGLMLAAGFILLIACANLAGLTLVRLLRRESKIATQLALGAPQWQIQQQLWGECLPLALAGGGAGIAVGFAALRGLLLLLPEHYLPVTVHLDGRVLGLYPGPSLCTSILFGMLPALGTRKVDRRASMASRIVIATGSVRLRQLLIAGEVALTVQPVS